MELQLEIRRIYWAIINCFKKNSNHTQPFHFPFRVLGRTIKRVAIQSQTVHIKTKKVEVDSPKFLVGS